MEYTLPKASSKATLCLINALGEKTNEVKLESNKGSVTIDLSQQSAGFYFINITDQSGRTCSRKVLKQ